MAITITAVSNPAYANSNNTAITCALTTNELGVIPYTAAAHDPMPYGQELWTALQAGTYGSIAPYVAPTLSAAQLANNAIAAGIVLTSTGTPALNGTYAVNANMQAQINAVVTYMVVNSAFPAGLTELPWPDASGTLHTFPTVASFQAFATAIANYVATVNIYANSNGAIGSIPSNAITIP